MSENFHAPEQHCPHLEERIEGDDVCHSLLWNNALFSDELEKNTIWSIFYLLFSVPLSLISHYSVLYTLWSSHIRLLAIHSFFHWKNICVLVSKDVSINKTDMICAVKDLVFWRGYGHLQVCTFAHLWQCLLTCLPNLNFVQYSFNKCLYFKAKFRLSLTHKVPSKVDLLLTFARLRTEVWMRVTYHLSKYLKDKPS